MSTIADALRRSARLEPFKQFIGQELEKKRKSEALQNLMGLFKEYSGNITGIFGEDDAKFNQPQNVPQSTSNASPTPIQQIAPSNLQSAPTRAQDLFNSADALQKNKLETGPLNFRSEMPTAKVEPRSYINDIGQTETENTLIEQTANVLQRIIPGVQEGPPRTFVEGGVTQRLIPGVNEPKERVGGLQANPDDIRTIIAPRPIEESSPIAELTGKTPIQGGATNKRSKESRATENIMNFLMEAMADPNADPQKIQLGLTALQTLTKGYEPKKRDVKGISTTDDVYDEYGNLIKKGIPKQGELNSRYERVEKFTEGGKDFYKGQIKGTSDWETIPGYAPEAKGTSVNVNTAEAPDIGTEEQNIENLRGDLDYFDNIIKKGPDKDGNYKVVDSKTRETTTASKEWVEDQKKAKQDRIKSQLKKNVTTVNAKIPHFKESYDILTKNVTKNSSDQAIDATVDKYMAKETYEARKWMKDYLKDHRRTL